MIGRIVRIVFIGFCLWVWPGPAAAVPNSQLSELFTRYEQHLDDFIAALTEKDWGRADERAGDLIGLSRELMRMGRSEQNTTWEYYASNLLHHAEELQEVSWKQESREAIYLVSTIIHHIGEIQAAIPVWLLDYISRQIQELEDAVAARDRKRMRDAAEVVHNSAHKIILSAIISRHSYRHTRWLTNFQEINRLGDQLVGGVDGNDWLSHEENLKRIQSIFATWKDGFHPVLLAPQP